MTALKNNTDRNDHHLRLLGVIAPLREIFVLLVGIAMIGCGRPQPLGPVANPDIAKEIRLAIAGSTGESGAAAEEGPVGTGWATLSGQFTYVGTAPTMPPYNVTKDTSVCMPGGHSPPQQTLEVDGSTGGIKNIAIFVRDASRVHESAQPREDTVVFDQKQCVFLSHVMGLTVGQQIEIKNSDPVGHNTKIDGKSNSFNQNIPADGSVVYPLQREEAMPAPVACSIHPWMQAYLLPRDNGYFAITAEDGSFELANLPAGEELEIQVWHESGTGPSNALVPGTPEAKELKWSTKGRFKVNLEPDEAREIKLAIPSTAFSI